MPLRSLYSSNSSYYNEKELPSNSNGNSNSNSNSNGNCNNRPSSSTGIRRPATNNKNPAGGKVSVLGIFDNSSGNKSRDQRRTPVVLPHILLAKPKENHVPEGYMASKYKRPMSAYSWKEKSVKAIEKMIEVEVQNKQLEVDDETFESEENEVDLYWNNVRISNNLLAGINFDQVKNYTIASTFYPEPSPTHRIYSVYKKQLREVSVPLIIPLSSTGISSEEGDSKISRNSSVGYLDNFSDAHDSKHQQKLKYDNISSSSKANAVVSQFDGLLLDSKDHHDNHDNARSNSNININSNSNCNINSSRSNSNNNITNNDNSDNINSKDRNSSRIKINKEKHLKFDIPHSDTSCSTEDPIIAISELSPRLAALSKMLVDSGGDTTSSVIDSRRNSIYHNSSSTTTTTSNNNDDIICTNYANIAANDNTIVDGDADEGSLEETKDVKIKGGVEDGKDYSNATFLPPIDFSGNDNTFNSDTSDTVIIKYSDTDTSSANDVAVSANS